MNSVEAKFLEYATRAVLQNPAMQLTALLHVTDGPHRPHDHMDDTLFALIRGTYRHIAEHGPNAHDIFLARQANIAEFERFKRLISRQRGGRTYPRNPIARWQT